MATAKIWHYIGDRSEGNRSPMPEEPYVSRQQVDTGSGVAASTAAPAGAHLARIEVTVATRCRVRLAGDATDADANDPLLFHGTDGQAAYNWLHCPPGATISLIESA